jgi:hypothetical protein
MYWQGEFIVVHFLLVSVRSNLSLVTHKTRLIRQGNFYIAINNYALAAQARCNARVYRPVNKVLFLVRYLLDVIHPLVNIYMAGAAAAYTAAIML